METDEPENDNKTNVKPITIVNANARSLCPKINSLIDCLEEMDAAVGIVTEIWLTDGDSLKEDLADLSAGAGVGLLCKNRPPNAAGISHGGVAIAYRIGACAAREPVLQNQDNYKVIVGVITLAGYSRKMVVVGCYIPPGYDVGRGRGAVSYIEDVLIEVKRRFRDPFLVVGGDFNQWHVEDAIQEFPDMKESRVGPTRKDKCLDRLFTNFGRSETESGTVPPLEVEPGETGAASDHKVSYVRAELLRRELLNGSPISTDFSMRNRLRSSGHGRWALIGLSLCSSLGAMRRPSITKGRLIGPLRGTSPW